MLITKARKIRAADMTHPNAAFACLKLLLMRSVQDRLVRIKARFEMIRVMKLPVRCASSEKPAYLNPNHVHSTNKRETNPCSELMNNMDLLNSDEA